MVFQDIVGFILISAGMSFCFVELSLRITLDLFMVQDRILGMMLSCILVEKF